MNILLMDMFGSFLINDMLWVLKKLGVNSKYVQYIIHNKENDEGFESKVLKELREGSFDMVFSTNYYPVLARICYGQGITYCAWEYDSPPEIISFDTLEYSTNRIFFFCKHDYEVFKNGYGFDNVYYLPLGVNVERLEKTRRDEAFASEVSLVGGLYDSESFLALRSIMSADQQQYFDAVVNVQLNHCGSKVIDAALTDEMVVKICEHYRNQSEKAIQPSKEQLFYAICSHVTHMERVALLRLSAKKGFITKLYIPTVSESNRQLLESSNVKICGSVSYEEEMPKVFKSSKVNLCPTLRANRTGIPLRVVDVLGTGGFLLVSHQEELDDFFREDEIAVYESIGDAIDKIDYYLCHEAERINLAQKAHERVKKDFRFENRVKTILEMV